MLILLFEKYFIYQDLNLFSELKIFKGFVFIPLLNWRIYTNSGKTYKYILTLNIYESIQANLSNLCELNLKFNFYIKKFERKL
jgi:hypothetical protein